MHLEIHGQLVDGSGLSELLDVPNLSITGAGNVLTNIPQITSAPYLLQVCLCAEFKALKEVYINSESTLGIQQWMEEMATVNKMFHYWKLIFDFQILILQFVRAQRQNNFLLYVLVLKRCMKYIFALNHYNYSRWLGVHVHDLMRLPVTCPQIYKEFLSGNFVLQKTENPFSAMALGQGHEQNNATIKGVGGAIGLLSNDMDSAFRRWEVAGPDVCRLIAEYEDVYGLNTEEVRTKHHEDYPAFQKVFFRDVTNVFNSFKDICNPFDEERLVTFHNGQIMSLDMQNCLANILDINEEKYRDFCEHRLERCDVPITDVKNNILRLPSGIPKDTSKVTRMQQAKSELKFAKSIQIASQYIDDLVKECFQYEVSDYPSSITVGCQVYHSSKSDLLKRLRDIKDAKVRKKCVDNTAIVVDLSVIVFSRIENL